MKILVISDSHDNLNNLEKLKEIIKEQEIDIAIHCGDFTAPFMARAFNEFPCKKYAVLGNVDGDIFQMLKLARDVEFEKFFNVFEFENKKIAFTHYPFIVDHLLKLNPDYVFYGHTHQKELKQEGKTKIINPGELAGIKNKATYCIIDLIKDKIDFFELENE